jgi:hypothetical protein
MARLGTGVQKVSETLLQTYTLFRLLPNTIFIYKMHNGIILKLRLRAEPQVP